MDTENDAEFFVPSTDRAHSRIRSTRVTEIADAGTPQERAKPKEEENGFMWNLNTYWRFVERDGGTFIQCESLTLTRDVPFALAWIIRPIVTQMPKESLTFTLAKTRRVDAAADLCRKAARRKAKIHNHRAPRIPKKYSLWNSVIAVVTE